jgi:3-oxoacyl-[acyl-carrier-protein] synthase II
VPNPAIAHSFDVALSNSFGFGGINASLVLRRWTE